MRQSELGKIVGSGRATAEQWAEYWSEYAQDVERQRRGKERHERELAEKQEAGSFDDTQAPQGYRTAESVKTLTDATTWQERRWREIRGGIATVFVWIIVFAVWDDIKSWISPEHPAPVSIEADGKSYIACTSPDIGRGYFHNTYHIDFKDNNGSTVTLRGIDKLIITNLPQVVNAPMPVFRSAPYPLPDVNGTDKDGKPYQEGYIYTWLDGSAAMFTNHQWLSVSGLSAITSNMEGQIVTYKEDEFRVLTGGKAQVKDGKWVPVKAKNTVCNHDE